MSVAQYESKMPKNKEQTYDIWTRVEDNVDCDKFCGVVIDFAMFFDMEIEEITQEELFDRVPSAADYRVITCLENTSTIAIYENCFS